MPETITPPKIVLHGDTTNGIELRYYDDGSLDEAVVYVDGKCVFHLEQMHDMCFWMGLYAGGHTAHVNIISKNKRSHLTAGADGWED